MDSEPQQSDLEKIPTVEIIRLMGGPSRAAITLGLGRTAVSMWLRHGRVPLKHAARVARALNVRPEQVCPELRVDDDAASIAAAA